MSLPWPTDGLLADAERPMVDGYLDYYRLVLAKKLRGAREDAARAPRTPSGMSLLGLVRHMAGVEQWWFVEVGTATKPRYDWTDAEFDADHDCDWKVPPDRTVESVLAYYERACDEARAAAANRSLDDMAVDPRTDPPLRYSLRWIYVHMIEETARHTGHADIFREQIDGQTGD
jgi:uncharacterized damage-inducible protein DinB